MFDSVRTVTDYVGAYWQTIALPSGKRVQEVATGAFHALLSGVGLFLNPGVYGLGFAASVLHPDQAQRAVQAVASERIPLSFSSLLVMAGNPSQVTMTGSFSAGASLGLWQRNRGGSGWVIGPLLRAGRDWAHRTAPPPLDLSDDDVDDAPSLATRVANLATLWTPTFFAALASPFYLTCGVTFSLIAPDTARAYRERIGEHLRRLTAEEVILGGAISTLLRKHFLPIATAGWGVHLGLKTLEEADQVAHGELEPLRIQAFKALPEAWQTQIEKIGSAAHQALIRVALDFHDVLQPYIERAQAIDPLILSKACGLAKAILFGAITSRCLERLPGPTILGASAAIFAPDLTEEIHQTVHRYVTTVPITTLAFLGGTLYLRASHQLKFFAAAAIGARFIRGALAERGEPLPSRLSARAIEAIKWVGCAYLAIRARTFFAFSFFAAVMQPAWAEQVTLRIQAIWDRLTDPQRATLLAIGVRYRAQAQIVASVAAGCFLMQKMEPAATRALPVRPEPRPTIWQRVGSAAYSVFQVILTWVPFFTNPGVYRAGSLTSLLFPDRFGQGLDKLHAYWTGLPTRLHKLGVATIFLYAFGTTSTILSFAAGAVRRTA